jgi:hypothetical protein
MRYPASEKLEIIRLVEESALPVRRTLEKIGIPRATFYRWYDLYQAGGPEALNDRPPKPDRVWNRIPDDVRERIIRLALDEPALSPRELAVRFTDTKFVLAFQHELRSGYSHAPNQLDACGLLDTAHHPRYEVRFGLSHHVLPIVISADQSRPSDHACCIHRVARSASSARTSHSRQRLVLKWTAIDGGNCCGLR